MISKAARRYSSALYAIAEERGNADQISGDIERSLELINANRELELFFVSPVISKNKKLAVVKDVFGKEVSELIMTFLNIIIDRRRESLVKDIFTDFLNLKKEKQGIVDVYVKTTVELNEQEKENMKKTIEAFTKLKSDMKFGLDNSIIGGFVATISDTVLDASIRRQLDLLRDRFRTGDISLN
ncbi:MAG TPA: ATP synthase F1 subunit delta [Ignavibacteria bacterium]|nr:ATP synthase F1 subunit delta [Bacteroidota bacterium]HRI85812.1 ATP synthase F1 subunit delta [Ignavibacteria bacterium]HRJ98959.1 ATP synthase F1 subunit delta [Ignavibacteria bacterium]